MLPASLLHTQLCIQQFSTTPSTQTLIQLRNSMQATLLMLPVPVVTAPQNDVCVPPKERVKTPKIVGNQWLGVSRELYDLYKKMIHTCTSRSKESFLVRFQTTPYVFSEVFMGKIMFPLFQHFGGVTKSFDYAYTHVVEPVFLYFADHEGQAYNPEDAFRAVGNIPNAMHDDYIFLISVLETYDPSRFRSSPHRGNIQIMFNPIKTRSARDLRLDFYIRAFYDARDTRDESSELPPVVNDVFASVFA
jgi:hypothetical protein